MSFVWGSRLCGLAVPRSAICCRGGGEYDGPALDAVSHRKLPAVRLVTTVVTTLLVTLIALPAVAQTAVVGELEERFGLVVEDPASWNDADLLSLLRGAEAIPRKVWDAVEGPVTVEYVRRPCLYSMGRYNDRCPTFDGSDRFYIYDEAPLAGEGSVERLAILTRQEQRDVQLRRAVVHLAMVHFDEESGWSDERNWQSVNGWLEDDERPLNRNPRGYSRYLGMQSAHLDLVTFAEEFFVRPEDVLLERKADSDVEKRLADVDSDGALECRHFTRTRIFRELLESMDESWEEPGRLESNCAEFEEWAKLDRLQGFEVWYAAGRSGRPESLFGHLLLQVRYGNASSEDDDIYHFDVVGDEEVGVIQFYLRRVLGGFSSVLEDEVDPGMLGEVRRYELRLDEEQSRRLMERLWEAERKMRYPYHFAAKNGATFLGHLLEPALGRPVSRQGSTVVMATDVLDGLARAGETDAGQLIELRDGEELFGRRALAPSGRHRLRFGGSFSPEAGQWRGRIAYARLAEDLGEPRLRGIRPGVGVRLLAMDVSLPVDERDFRQMSWDLTVFRYESLERLVRPDSQGFGGRIGWRLDGTLYHDGRREVWAGADLRPSVLFALAANSTLSRHLVLSAGPALGYDVHRGHDFYTGGALGLFGRLHLYGSHANALRFGVETGQYTSVPFGWHFDWRGQAELRHTLVRRGEYRWVAAPYVEGLGSTRLYGEVDDGEVFEVWEVGLRLEAAF